MMLLQFWQKRLWIKLPKALLLYLFLTQSYAGLFEHIKETKKISDLALKKAIKEAKKNTERLKSPLESSTITKLYLENLLAHSDAKYIQLAHTSKCHFYSLLEQGFLRTSLKNNSYILVTQDKKDYLESKKSFFNRTYSKECSELLDFKNSLAKQGLAQLLNNYDVILPKNRKDCLGRVKAWRDRAEISHLCKETKKEAKKLTAFQSTYFSNLCKNINKPELFCTQYTSSDNWKRALARELTYEQLSYRCKGIVKKRELSAKDLRECITSMNKKPQLCLDLNHDSFQAITPKPDCHQAREFIGRGPYQTNYLDCPGKTADEGIINTSRIIRFFENKKVESKPSTCAALSSLDFAKLSLDQGENENWPFQICHFNKYHKKEECSSFLYNSVPGSPLSEEIVIAEKLDKVLTLRNKLKCKIIDSKEYRPHLLKYKTGCFLIADEKTCSAVSCPKKIMLNQKEISSLTYKDRFHYSYFSHSYSDKNRAIHALLKKKFALNDRPLKNFTQIKLFFENNKGIIHGMACAEDLMPAHFKRHHLGGCRPIPFLIDAAINDDPNHPRLSVILPLDDSMTKRNFLWKRVYSAIKNYQLIHPQGAFHLYALQK